MNSCTFCGRLVADAEMKAAKSGTMVCNFRIASDTGWGDNKKTHFLSCVVFGERGVKLQPHLKKGGSVTVVGELTPPRMYTSNGETKAAQDLKVYEVALTGNKEGGNDRPRTDSAAKPAPPPSDYGTYPYNDDVPF